MQKILFHDVDGCLNTADGAALPFEFAQLLTSQKDALRALGVSLDDSDIDIMVLNTGRSLEATIFIAEAIGSVKLRYVIAEHGALGYSMLDKNDLDFAYHARSVPQLGSAYATVNKIESLVNWYVSEGANLLANEIGHMVVASSKRANLTLKIPDGFSGDNMMMVVRKLIETRSPVAGDKLVYHHSASDGYLDVMAEVDKGDAVQIICHLESQRSLHTYAVGNGTNDLPMFRQVDSCVGPSNSDDLLLSYLKQNGGLISEHSFIDATLSLLKTL
ncbi:MAG: hydroxymethylpyrimidine pyrophosphatase-like HAD family hydrolase, partial [Candidatus Azotimanducaceae bacterium]